MVRRDGPNVEAWVSRARTAGGQFEVPLAPGGDVTVVAPSCHRVNGSVGESINAGRRGSADKCRGDRRTRRSGEAALDEVVGAPSQWRCSNVERSRESRWWSASLA
jgi:hypothetical protein